MLAVEYSGRFKKDLKLMEKRSLDMRKILAVMLDLENEAPLQPKHKPHQLQGAYKGYWECHIEPDWLLIYHIDHEAGALYFARTGTHADYIEVLEVTYMMYPYMTLADETLITHSHLLGDGENKSVEVHFERPRPYGFDMARCSLPSYEWIIRDGYTDDEIAKFERLLQDGAHTFFKYAAMGGLNIAKAV